MTMPEFEQLFCTVLGGIVVTKGSTGMIASGLLGKPGVPRSVTPSSKPCERVDDCQCRGLVPAPDRWMRSMLALIPPEGFCPANGVPLPSSTSSMIAPLPSLSRSRSLVLGRLIAVLVWMGMVAKREADAWLLLTMRYSHEPIVTPLPRRAMTISSPLLLRDVMVQPARLVREARAPVAYAAISIHSSAVLRSVPIHWTSERMGWEGVGGGGGKGGKGGKGSNGGKGGKGGTVGSVGFVGSRLVVGTMRNAPDADSCTAA